MKKKRVPAEVFKPYIVKRPDDECQILFPLLDQLIDELIPLTKLDQLTGVVRERPPEYEYYVTRSKRCGAISVEEAMVPVHPPVKIGWKLVSVLVVWNDTFCFWWERRIE